jgi:hypothetical protein
MSEELSMNAEPAEVAILRRVVQSGKPFLNKSAAKSILALTFSDEDMARLRELAAKARAGQLTDGERHEMDVYGQIGSLISILKSKARVTLADNSRRRLAR